jgi:hypothetical protein
MGSSPVAPAVPALDLSFLSQRPLRQQSVYNVLRRMLPTACVGSLPRPSGRAAPRDAARKKQVARYSVADRFSDAAALLEPVTPPSRGERAMPGTLLAVSPELIRTSVSRAPASDWGQHASRAEEEHIVMIELDDHSAGFTIEGLSCSSSSSATSDSCRDSSSLGFSHVILDWGKEVEGSSFTMTTEPDMEKGMPAKKVYSGHYMTAWAGAATALVLSIFAILFTGFGLLSVAAVS